MQSRDEAMKPPAESLPKKISVTWVQRDHSNLEPRPPQHCISPRQQLPQPNVRTELSIKNLTGAFDAKDAVFWQLFKPPDNLTTGCAATW